MIKVTLRQNESFESLMRRFSASVAADGILKELKERARYEKPSIKKRRLKRQRKVDFL
jgi:small subunit ribosomal protein S21